MSGRVRRPDEPCGKPKPAIFPEGRLGQPTLAAGLAADAEWKQIGRIRTALFKVHATSQVGKR